VKSKRPTREQLIELAKTDPEAIADLVLMLWDRVEMLEARVAELERNSRSSSKPPSSDKGNFTNPPKPKSLRGRDANPAAKKVTAVTPCAKPILPMRSSNTVLDKTLFVRDAAPGLAGLSPGPWNAANASADRSSSYPPSGSK